MSENHTYDVAIKWDHDRKGTMSSTVLDQPIEVATPPEFDKGIEGVWSPEHLFVASVSSCLMTTFLAIAEYSKLSFQDLNIKATGKMEKVDGKYMFSEITLHPVLTINDEKYTEKAERILQKSEEACLISNSIKTNIKLEPEIVVAEMMT
ncbi:MAG TPA: OsmC family protein [Balneolaceae bacterium]|nr:OsmC family protein [Balneolaceae bacterium]